MSDVRRQRAGRAVRQTGTTQDQARLLRERARAGELTDEQLRTAALIGEPGAAEALGEEPGRLPATCEDLRAWADDLGRLGRRPRTITIGALGDLFRARWSTDEQDAAQQPEDALLDAVRRHAKDERAVTIDEIDDLTAQVMSFLREDQEPGIGVSAARALRSRRAFNEFVDDIVGSLRDAPAILGAIIAAVRPWALGEVVVPTEPARPARSYSPTATFAVGDVVLHPTFGEGLVVTADARRVTVQFAGGARQLVHGQPERR